MAFIRRVRTASGVTAVQIAEYSSGRQRIVRHVGSAHSEAELGLLLEQARGMLKDPGQGLLDLGVEPSPRVAPLLPGPVGQGELAGPAARGERGEGRRDLPGRVVGTSSAVLFDALAGVFTALGFDAVEDAAFRDLVIARIVEPTSMLDAGRVLADLGRVPTSYATMKRALTRAKKRNYRDEIATRCFQCARAGGDNISLVLYDVTTLYFEAENEYDLRKVGYSKERRVDPQIVVGLLVDRGGFPLEIGCFGGNKAETATIVPIIKQFQQRHGLADMVVVADAGMLSAANLRELDQAEVRLQVRRRLGDPGPDDEPRLRPNVNHVESPVVNRSGHIS